MYVNISKYTAVKLQIIVKYGNILTTKIDILAQTTLLAPIFREDLPQRAI